MEMKGRLKPDLKANILAMHPDARCFRQDYFLFDISKQVVIDSLFEINTYGFFLCREGRMSGTIDLMPFELRPGGLIVNVPGQLVVCQSMSDDFRGTGQVMTPGFVESLGLPYNFGMAIGIREHPLLELKAGELSAIQTYCSMVRNLLVKERPFQAEALRHLTCAYAYSLGYYLYQMEETRKLSGDELTTQRFLSEVRQLYKWERSVAYYADRMHLTPGYLSSIVRNVSGKTALEWIDSFVLLEAKVLLKSTNLTIQQISQELHFPSQSFFGKYFKRLTGISPKAFRENQ